MIIVTGTVDIVISKQNVNSLIIKHVNNLIKQV